MKKILVSTVLAVVLTSTVPAYAMSQADLAQLNELLQKRDLEVLGAPPTYAPYDKHYDTVNKEVPPPNCDNPKIIARVFDSKTGRTFVRWWCSNPI